MSSNQQLPSVQESLVDSDGKPTRAWRNWFASLRSDTAAAQVTATAAAAAIAATRATKLPTITSVPPVLVYGDTLNPIIALDPSFAATIAQPGSPGMAGEDGPEGDRGPPGDKGVKGDKGDAGDRGSQGEDGQDGADGPPGPTGAAGASGSQAAIQFKDEGVSIGSSGAITSVDFVGSGVVATVAGTAATVTIAGGGSAGVGAQVGYAKTVSTTTASDTGASTIPTASIPQNTDGVAYASLDTAITPSASTSLLEVEVVIDYISGSNANSPRFALFRDAGANAIAATYVTIAGIDYGHQMRLIAVVAAGSTSATTFKLRWSGQAASGQTAYILRNSGGGLFGTTALATMIVREIKQ